MFEQVKNCGPSFCELIVILGFFQIIQIADMPTNFIRKKIRVKFFLVNNWYLVEQNIKEIFFLDDVTLKIITMFSFWFLNYSICFWNHNGPTFSTFYCSSKCSCRELGKVQNGLKKPKGDRKQRVQELRANLEQNGGLNIYISYLIYFKTNILQQDKIPHIAQLENVKIKLIVFDKNF